jgi:uncharacterized protein YyaL (SSP411 family)
MDNRDQSKSRTNRLINETSLYLQQHAHNPVNWFPWGDEAFHESRSQNKLIFLSIGYSSCHWCHVMERESFENEDIASFLNTHYVSIKVDREERPDIDSIYMEAVQMMTGHGGWPLNIWLTPDLKPIYGGTYFPPESTHHRPGFMDVLSRLLEVFNNEPDTIEKRTSEIIAALGKDLFEHVLSGTISFSELRKSIATTRKNYDDKLGGFSNAPKFPSAMHIEFLLRYDKLVGDESAKQMALHSLRKICLGGIYDQAGGGFHRYSTDDRWLVPHFEKMLYDNALLLSALTDAWKVSKDIVFKDAMESTLEFIQREMTSNEGGFYAAIDADSMGEEGLFYIWDYNELEQLIPKSEFPEFAAYFDVFPDGNWENKIILNRVHSCLDFSILTQSNHDELIRKIKSWKNILLQVREKRIRPVTDTKVITSWNAMMLKSLCKVWMITGCDNTFQMLIKNANFLRNYAIRDNKVYRISTSNDVKVHGFCDDYALLAEAFAHVFMVTGDENWLSLSEILADSMIVQFYIPEHNSFAYTRENQNDVLFRKKDVFDNATPSANSAALSALNLLGKLTGRNDFIKTSTDGCNALGSLTGDYALSFGYLLQLFCEKLSHHGAEIVILGDQNKTFLSELAERYLPFHIIITGSSVSKTKYETLKGKSAPKSGSNVYVCKNFTCEQPVSDVKSFISLL